MNHPSQEVSLRVLPAGGGSAAIRGSVFVRLAIVCLMFALIAVPVRSLLGQDASAPAADANPAITGPNVQQRQQQVAENYKRLEELLIRLADVEASTHPERAALLRRAARRSSETFVLKQLEDATQALDRKQFQLAIENQSSASQNLASLLKLLLTEDRQERIREEKDRIKRIKQDIERRLRQQAATRARTENGVDTEELKDEQAKIAEQTKELSDELSGEEDASDAASETDSESMAEQGKESKPGEESEGSAGKQEPSQEGKPGEDGKPSGDKKPAGEQDPDDKKPSPDDKPGDKSKSPEDKEKPAGEKPSDGKSKPGEESKPGGESKPSEAGKPQPSEAQPGQPQEGQPQEGQPQEQSPAGEQPPQTPQDSAAQRLDQAQQKMREAEKQLEDAKRDGAVEKQREAEQLLRQAIDDLDRILRQLREEEKERELARLEARFRKMAEMQTQVYERTKELDEIPADVRDRSFDIRSGNLAFEEKKIILEADRALLVLKEEGSSVAFPEVVQQMRGDMQHTADRLAESKVSVLTQGLQEDILAAIEEMIAALQQAQRELEEKKDKPKPPGQPQQGSPGESPLVQPIAELKLIRTLETRIKSTTQRYAKMLPDGTPELPQDLRELVDELSQRQLRLYRVTRDIVQQNNR